MKINFIIRAGILCLLIKPVWAICPKGQIEDTETKHCLQTGNACKDNKCTYYYDTTTHDMNIKPNPGVTGNVEIIYVNYGKLNLSVKNLTLGEGITKIGSLGIFNVGTKEGTLKLPSSLTSIEYFDSIYNNGFGTVDVSDVTSFSGKLFISGPLTKNVVVSDNSPSIKLYEAYGKYPENVNIQCKGNMSKCSSKGFIYNSSTHLSFGYYINKDDKGNILEVWDENGKKTYSYKYAANGDYAMYDGDGNFLGRFMANGQKRRIYAIDEAVAVTEKGGKNTFSIRYR